MDSKLSFFGRQFERNPVGKKAMERCRNSRTVTWRSSWTVLLLSLISWAEDNNRGILQLTRRQTESKKTLLRPLKSFWTAMGRCRIIWTTAIDLGKILDSSFQCRKFRTADQTRPGTLTTTGRGEIQWFPSSEWSGLGWASQITKAIIGRFEIAFWEEHVAVGLNEGRRSGGAGGKENLMQLLKATKHAQKNRPRNMDYGNFLLLNLLAPYDALTFPLKEICIPGLIPPSCNYCPNLLSRIDPLLARTDSTAITEKRERPFVLGRRTQIRDQRPDLPCMFAEIKWEEGWEAAGGLEGLGSSKLGNKANTRASTRGRWWLLAGGREQPPVGWLGGLVLVSRGLASRRKGGFDRQFGRPIGRFSLVVAARRRRLDCRAPKVLEDPVTAFISERDETPAAVSSDTYRDCLYWQAGRPLTHSDAAPTRGRRRSVAENSNKMDLRNTPFTVQLGRGARQYNACRSSISLGSEVASIGVNGDKAASPDGFTSSLYSTYWDFIQELSSLEAFVYPVPASVLVSEQNNY
ncbi:hypothetical protein M5K25_010498 [Dendrobium thyrsiflorum]|uniref:Uncharacterized protein n=1 Tax=Dendrobium thyrsiflorum TaxID=117978 RepID=A0ABD0V0S7_DENTH